MPISENARLEKVIKAQFENCLKRVATIGTSFTQKTSIEERCEVYGTVITQTHALLEAFNTEHLRINWLDYKIDRGDNIIKLSAGNLYSFIVLCGETPPPWDWLDQTQYKGELGVYQERDTCYTLKRRPSHHKTLAKFDRYKHEQ